MERGVGGTEVLARVLARRRGGLVAPRANSRCWRGYQHGALEVCGVLSAKGGNAQHVLETVRIAVSATECCPATVPTLCQIPTNSTEFQPTQLIFNRNSTNCPNQLVPDWDLYYACLHAKSLMPTATAVLLLLLGAQFF
jgi:hypothetical protein